LTVPYAPQHGVPGVPTQAEIAAGAAYQQVVLGYQPSVPFPPQPPQPGPGFRVVRPPRWRAITVAIVLCVLAGVVAWQAMRLEQVSDRLAQTQAQAQADREAAKTAADTMASRVATLEKADFRPDQIAASALPSVFRVKAGQFSGTAWAVGKPTSGGGAYLFTNFHVVESVWTKGEKKVGIEHKDLRFDATIVKVDKDKDLAQLETTAKFTGLAVAAQAVRPGEPIVVVGAPLGLDSSVTTGVVSAFRKLEGTDETYVQFDAPINPGNSGGPVINAQGQVVGIATAKLKNAEGIGLAIPIGLACEAFPICG
jgi:S1-C subfamily serine protease